MSQCPTCGRVSEDWSSNKATGHKEQQRKTLEDRTAVYRSWRFGLGNGCYVCDVDQVEWRGSQGGVLRPVATIELTRVDGNVDPPPSYFGGILNRFKDRDFHAEHSKSVAEALGVDCFITAFRWDMTEFWVYNLSRSRGWWHLWPKQYERWIRTL